MSFQVELLVLYRLMAYYLHRLILFSVFQSYLLPRCRGKKAGINCSCSWQYSQASSAPSSVWLSVWFLCSWRQITGEAIDSLLTPPRIVASGANKVSVDGRKRQEPASAEGSMKHRGRHNARAGSSSASRWLSEIKEVVSSSLTQA